ncbi:MAG: signal peptidase II [Spirochaetaceae bacterium]|jgi:signal peptidase II|nr:signal peptidase II [Spirochaetaceae bacterium]
MTENNSTVLKKALPFSLTVLIVLLDQITKSYIAGRWPIGTMIADVFNNDLLRVYHVRNKVIAFSLGAGLPESIRPALFIVLPLIVLGFLCFFYWKSNDFTGLQRWAVAGIIGGGIGNLIDRIFRPEGVVDFISVKFFGILGFERWPTFNIADSSVVVCIFIWLISLFFPASNAKREVGP